MSRRVKKREKGGEKRSNPTFSAGAIRETRGEGRTREIGGRRERENEPSLTNEPGREFSDAGIARIFLAARVPRPRRTTWIFWYLPGVNAGRWSPRAAPFYLVTITLGCMKCATGIQPSPHNSPIYDWAKLLSMRRIKSRARVQEKSAGRRDGRPRRRSSRSCVAFPRRA